MDVITNLLGKHVRTPTEDEVEGWHNPGRYAESRKRWIGKRGEVVGVYLPAPSMSDRAYNEPRVRLIMRVTESDTDDDTRIGELLDLSLSLCTVIEGGSA